MNIYEIIKTIMISIKNKFTFILDVIKYDVYLKEKIF